MKKQFVLLLTIGLVVGLIYSCTKNKGVENKDDTTKEIITTENVGEAHNYLLGIYRQNIKTKSIAEKATFGEVYQEMEKLFNESDKYSTKTEIGSSTKSLSTDLLESLNALPLDSNFPVEVKKIFKEYIATSNLDEEVVDLLLKTSENYKAFDLSTIDTNLLSTYESDLLYIYNDVYESSSEYWAANINTNTSTKRSATNSEIIWSDAAGALLGAACGGVMSILMGASFSHCMEKCAQMN
jgi:hypothetical protein